MHSYLLFRMFKFINLYQIVLLIFSQSQCASYIQGKFNQTDKSIGYYINLAIFKCVTISGDLIVAGAEMCDDGNDNPIDGCNMCANLCDLCIFGVCISAQFSIINTKCKSEFYLLNNNGKCAPICGDKIVSYYQEQWDDGNLISYDGCDLWQLTCQEQFMSCLFLQMLTMQLRIQIKLKTKIVHFNMWRQYTIFSDGIISKFQYCDDFNFIIEDGCSNYSFQCEKTCNLCSFGICVSCQNGYYLNQSKKQCFPICGDKMIQGDSGCINCQLYALHNVKFAHTVNVQNVKSLQDCIQIMKMIIVTLNMEIQLLVTMKNVRILILNQTMDAINAFYNIFGQCQQCDYGYTLINNKFKSVCDDGIKPGNEECDIGIINLMDQNMLIAQIFRWLQQLCLWLMFKMLKQFWILFQFKQFMGIKMWVKIVMSFRNHVQVIIFYGILIVININLEFAKVVKMDINYYQINAFVFAEIQFKINNEDCENDDIIPFGSCYLCKYQCQNECQQ
ncbi:unnamed protein product [Paramecium sonneborni]|uniref:Transmembrane protein n=1 Tax=Paramecium sonneborni TaxID=65129 RepID=A0A8S1RUT9_9CILI|nr:unnamed protein product [Paramecium sonneborni]